MPQELVSPEEFLSRLEKCFSDPSSSDTVWLTHKRFTHQGGDTDVPMSTSTEEGDEYQVLIRCTHGSTKFSSRIPASSLETFHSTYGSLLKSSMAPAMRKRDKKKEKAKAELLAKKKRELYVDVEIGDGGKRGKGRRQRQRKIAAQKKKEEEREKLEARTAAQAKATQ